jgi:hypothetical protein
MTEHPHQYRIRQALVERLLSINGAAPYRGTVERVIPVAAYEIGHFRDQPPAFALIRRGSELCHENTNYGLIEESEFWILVCRKWEPTTTPAWAQRIPEDLVQDEIVEDVERSMRMWKNPQTGVVEPNITLGLDFCHNIEVTDKDRDRHLEGWACVEFRVMVSWNHYPDFT